MKPLLLVLNPRRIEECIASIERLPCDQVWFTGAHEYDWNDPIADLMQMSARYSHYIVITDDFVVPRHAFDTIVDTLAAGHPAVSGYVNLHEGSCYVNLTKTPFEEEEFSRIDDYDFYLHSEVLAYPEPLVPTFFSGCPIGMTRELWLEFPFDQRIVTRKFGNVEHARAVPHDWTLSKRLTDAGVPIVAHQAAFCWHVKEDDNQGGYPGRKRVLVGEIEPAITWRLR